MTGRRRASILTQAQRRGLQALDSPIQAKARRGQAALTRKIRRLARRGPSALVDLLNADPDSLEAFTLMCRLAKRPPISTIYSPALTGVAYAFLTAIASVAFAAGSKTPMAYAGPCEVAARAAMLFQEMGQRAARGRGQLTWGQYAVSACADLRSFFLWLMDVDPEWLRRLRRCEWRGCRRFFWGKRGGRRGPRYCRSGNCRTWAWRWRQARRDPAATRTAS